MFDAAFQEALAEVCLRGVVGSGDFEADGVESIGLLLEHLDTLAETSSKAISNIKFDKVVVWENGGGNGRSATADFLNGMAKSLPPMMQVMRDIGGVELPESVVKFTDDTARSSAAGDANGSSAEHAKAK